MKLPEGVTKEHVEAWKKEHGTVRMCKLENGFKAIIHSPSRGVANQYEKFMDSDPNKARDILIKNCVLHGQSEVMTKDEYYYSCAFAIAEMIPLTKGETEDL